MKRLLILLFAASASEEFVVRLFVIVVLVRRRLVGWRRGRWRRRWLVGPKNRHSVVTSR